MPCEFDRAEIAGAFAGSGAVVFVSGSHQAGYANRLSDYDLFVVTETESGAPRSERRPPITAHDGRRVDFRYIPRRVLLDLAEQINAIDPMQPDAVAKIAPDELVIYYRTAIGEPLLRDADFERLRGNFQMSVAGAIYATQQSQRALALADAAAVLRSDAPFGAYVRGRAAIAALVNAYTADHGAGYPSEKLGYHKLASLHGYGSIIFGDVWAYTALGDREMEGYVASVGQACRQYAQDRADRTRPAPLQFRRDIAACSGRRWVDPHVSRRIVRAAGPGKSVDPAVAELWRTLALASLEDVIGAVDADQVALAIGACRILLLRACNHFLAKRGLQPADALDYLETIAHADQAIFDQIFSPLWQLERDNPAIDGVPGFAERCIEFARRLTAREN
jgi:predicted nucleotidyltransferase